MEIPMDLDGKTCVKCDLKAKFTGVDPKKAWYCQECFIQMVRNKFRSAISKKKIYKDAEARSTLIVYDGSPSAAFLLNQIDDALKQITFKRLMIQPTILVLISVTDEALIRSCVARVQEIKKVLVESVRWIVCHVASCMYEKIPRLEDDTCNGVDKIPDYLNLLNSCSVPTYRTELERILREKCLRNISDFTQISKVMVPDDADDLGRLAIDQLCLGRGGSLSSLVSVVDRRSSTFTLIRPLRDVSKKEIAIVNFLTKIDNHCVQMVQNQEIKSVQTLTDNFIRTLENEKFYNPSRYKKSTKSGAPPKRQGETSYDMFRTQ
uniref:Cytoplasmic tRNA 2-thiolation protein 2 n=1 Tax=Caenorhabditis japonica TaxID=281687 RepID=A0A8R1DFI8_CAEJA